ncbi:DNA-3-methyladenine glycosylase family protein [Candidatus Nanohalococcus occultus]|uniref:DNA-(apurinic or apyrimidinic site) lyase n=1 Tax=Candidatus Nanohalococcus occultus TaxID=2978047 RepID=A0ABY8CFN9_9ARCH|nr:3-methyladenine DNA glycosylase/8-oxoguanine DNAglycosylase [Candidatus Nanohaloarchaeota archaeon SVXNc]
MRHELNPETFDLEQTLTCGQTFCWHRFEGQLYDEDGEKRFYSFVKDQPVIVEEKDGKVIVETPLEKQEVEEALGLHKDVDKIFDNFPEDERIEKAREEFEGLRIIQDEFFPCLISYLMSPQMRIPRIKKMFNKIAEQHGEKIEYKGETLLKFPDHETLLELSEDELRDIGVGYRAKYIAESMKILEEFEHTDLDDMSYEEAREEMKKLYGVGDKVADCVLLFSKDFTEAAPLDTWAKKALKSQFPELHSEDYDEASVNIREYFGSDAGYALEYVFHAARNGVLEVEDE